MATKSIDLTKLAKKSFETIYKLTQAFGEKPSQISVEHNFATCKFSPESGIDCIYVATIDGAKWLPGFPNFMISSNQLRDFKAPKVLGTIAYENDNIVINKAPTELIPESKVILPSFDITDTFNPFSVVDDEHIGWIELPLPEKMTDDLKFNFATGHLMVPGAEATSKTDVIVYLNKNIVPKSTVADKVYMAIEAYDEKFVYPMMYSESEKYKILVKFMKVLR